MNHPELKYPEADALALAALLEKNGYVVDKLLGQEATQNAIEKKLAGLVDYGNAAGCVVLGFFGHGVEFESSQEAMFIPYNSKRRLALDGYMV